MIDTSYEEVAKRTAKDTVFRDLFSEPEYLLQLYNCLHPEDKDTKAEDLEIVTLESVLTNQPYNDLGFLVGSRLVVLVEAQSTWSVNIALRCLMYMASTLSEYVQDTSQNYYGSRAVHIPKPELYMVYTGERKDKLEWISLAEEFLDGDSTFLECRVKVLYGENKGDIINQYVAFAHVIDDMVRRYGRTKRAVDETIRICRECMILEQYLTRREKEVIDIMMALFSQEKAIEMYGKEQKESGRAEGRIEGRVEGFAEGRAEERKELILNLFRNTDMSDSDISAVTRIPIEEIVSLRKASEAGEE